MRMMKLQLLGRDLANLSDPVVGCFGVDVRRLVFPRKGGREDCTEMQWLEEIKFATKVRGEANDGD